MRVEQDVLDSLKSFLHDAEAGSWLTGRELPLLEELSTRGPGKLFDPSSHRPLTAAFFGGTGVGKSSLLNRLAGQNIARTGIERPTSREVSLYLHESISFRQLPNDLPVEEVRLARHAVEANRQILWVDMPDIDSVDQSNRELVLSWLPHVDVLIYVVSPERYRDDKGWRLLRAHGGEHAWLFVLNQWDRGEEVQYEDFRTLLMDSGFEDPIILKTIAATSSTDPTSGIHELTSLLEVLTSRHLIAQLDAHAGVALIDALRVALADWIDQIQGHGDYQELLTLWERIWEETLKDLMDGMEWTFAAVVRMLMDRFGGTQVSETEGSKSTTARPKDDSPPVLWDAWAEGRVKDSLSQLMVAAGEKRLPVVPLKHQVDPIIDETGHRVLQRGQLRLRHALAMPGNAFQRTCMRVASVLTFLLPMLACGWASYQVVIGYYQSATLHLDYLGTDFAVHTLLLIGLAWFAPWIVYSRLRPSLEVSALKGLRSGVREALVAEGQSIRGAIENTARSQQVVLDRLMEISLRLDAQASNAEREYAPLVRRMIARTQGTT
jgi:50S ribosome-binding GTPase